MAIRATALLFPLLGMTNILFCVEPSSSVIYKFVYRVANALLQSSQVLDYVHIGLADVNEFSSEQNQLGIQNTFN